MEILIIVGLNLLLYVRTMKFLLVADDLQWYMKKRSNRRKFKDFFKTNNVINGIHLWLYDTFYGGFTFGRNVSMEHLFTTALHATIASLIYLAFGQNPISFWAALLYSCNPINNQTSIWLNGRRYAINLILVLCIVMVSRLEYGWIPALLMYWMTAIFQVTAIFAPVLFLWQYPLIALLFPVIIAYRWPSIVHKIKNRYQVIKDADRREFTPKRLIVVVKVYGIYFFKIFFPGICAMTYPKLHFWGQTKEGNKDAYSFNKDFLVGVFALAISLYLGAVLNNELRFFWVFMCLSILQWCAIIPVVQDLADRYAGMGALFGMYFLSFFIHQHFGDLAVPILAGFCCYYIPYLFTVMKMYRSEAARWDYQRYHFPQLPAPLKFEVEHLIHDKGNPLRAWVLIQEYLKYGGKDFTILFQAAKCHQAVFRLEEARQYAKLASENLHLYKEEDEKKQVEVFLAACVMPSGTAVGPLSRQLKRAEQRKADKANKSVQSAKPQ